MYKKKPLYFVMAVVIAVGYFGLIACNKPKVEGISFDKTSIVIKVEEEHDLKVTLSPHKVETDITYISTDKSVVTIDKRGVIKGVKEGSAVVYATTYYGGFVAACTVAVIGEKGVPLTDFSIDIGTLPIKGGGEYRMSIVPIPNNANDYNILWSSSVPLVASISAGGELTALAAGSTILTAKDITTNIEKRLNVTVAPRDNRIELDYVDILGKAGDTLTLDYTLISDFSEDSGSWSSSIPTVATIDASGKIKFLSEGKTALTRKIIVDGIEVTAQCLVTVKTLSNCTVLRTVEDLESIRNKSGNYALGNDIDFAPHVMEGGVLYNNGAGFSPLYESAAAAYKGTFDGNGYSIKNILINRPSLAFASLFGYINAVTGAEAKIFNLSLDGGSIIGGAYTASFFGSCNGAGSSAAMLKNCLSSVNIMSTANGGGLAGHSKIVIENSLYLGKNTSEGTNSALLAVAVQGGANVGVRSSFALKADGTTDKLIGVNFDSAFVPTFDALKTKLELESTAYFAAWDTGIWDFEEGRFPRLKTLNYSIGEVR